MIFAIDSAGIPLPNLSIKHSNLEEKEFQNCSVLAKQMETSDTMKRYYEIQKASDPTAGEPRGGGHKNSSGFSNCPKDLFDAPAMRMLITGLKAYRELQSEVCGFCEGPLNVDDIDFDFGLEGCKIGRAHV